MNNKRKYNISRRIFYLCLMGCLACLLACSTTSHLPEGGVLYTGVASITEVGENVVAINEADPIMQFTALPANVREAVNLTLEVPPTEAFLGSAYRGSPLPFGLWAYNSLYTEKQKGLRHWLWKRFKKDPILVSDVNPELRCQAAEATLKDHGFFDAKVLYDTVFRDESKRKAKISYSILSRQPKYIAGVEYFAKASPRVEKIVNETMKSSFLHVGERFSTENLQQERDRLVQTIRDRGYYYYNEEQIKFLADTTHHDGGVHLRVYCCANADEEPRGLLPCTFDSILVNLDWGAGYPKSHHDTLGFFTQHYNGHSNLMPLTVRNCFPMRYHSLYRSDRPTRAQTNLSRLNTFKYVQLSLDCLTDDPEADSLSLCVRADATYAAPWQGKLDASFLYKDNDQIGPAITFTTIRRNIFHGGETFSATVNAAYEWSLGNTRIKNRDNVNNSYEFGLQMNLSSPRLYLPHFLMINDLRFPVSTRLGLSLSTQARAGFFSLVKSTAELTYSYYTSPVSSHSFTPLRLSYSHMLHTTPAFDHVISSNMALRQSFDDRLIPQLQYVYTYDDTKRRAKSSQQHYLQFSLSESAGLIDAINSLLSNSPHGSRTLFSQTYSQFLRGSVDFRYYLSLSPDVRLAFRLLGGLAYAYGNSTSIPYTETFYVGGPNSLRGFSIRGIGPGCNTDYRHADYGYLMQVGDLKLEANAELRFPIVGDIKGALFADAGNVWRLRGSDQFDRRDYLHDWRDLATDAGFGFRYDLGMLVVRFDIGLPLHDPGREGAEYFNCRRAMIRQLEYNLAIGYPF